MKIIAGLLAAGALIASATLAQAQTNMDEGYPDACKSEGMKMDEDMTHAAMKDHQKAAMAGMMKMNRNMMQGMMKDDADVAFVCGMIAHHQGAIDMAKVELQYGKDDWSKAMAKKVIEAQTKEIEDMTGWLKENAK